MQQAAVHGLQAIADIGERPVHDGGKGVSEVALLEGFLEVDLLDVFRALRRGNVLAHDSGLIAFRTAENGSPAL